jgi:hypothetical protein
MCGLALATLHHRGSAVLIMLLQTLSETDQGTTEQGVGRVSAYPAL